MMMVIMHLSLLQVFKKKQEVRFALWILPFVWEIQHKCSMPMLNKFRDLYCLSNIIGVIKQVQDNRAM